MMIWHYRPDTGELLAPGLADPNPREPGAWLIPAHATAEPPPAEVPAGMIAVFLDGAWAVVAQPEE